MKAVVFAMQNHLDVVDLEIPSVEPDEVRVKIAYAGICGTDLHKSERANAEPGFILGHEFVGTVDELGANVSGWKEGDRVVILPMVACGECWGCKIGKPEICLSGLYDGPGLGRNGGFAEYVSIPAGMLRRLPDDMKMEHAVLVEPLSVGLHGIQRSGAKPEDGVVVLGGGPIGAFAAISLRARGHKDVLVIEANDSRRQNLVDLGFETATPGDAKTVSEKVFGSRGPVVALDCTGHESGTPLALELLGMGGTLVVIGTAPVPVPIMLQQLSHSEIVLTGSLGYDDRDYAEAIDHIAHGRVPCEQVSKIARLEEAQHWFDVLLSRKSNELKVILQP